MAKVHIDLDGPDGTPHWMQPRPKLTPEEQKAKRIERWNRERAEKNKPRARALARETVIGRFDETNPAAIAWAKEHAAELVTQITDTTRELIRDAVVHAQETGEDAEEAIAEILDDEDRAERIARHEAMVAANEGQRQAWDQAVDDGLLSGDERRVWIATDDERVCPVCEELDGAVTDLDGLYPDGSDGPPAHVQCRCTEGLTNE